MFSNFLLIYSDWAVFLLHLILGVVLIAHGWPKMKDIKATAIWFSSVGFKPGGLWAPIVAIAEFLGGVLFIIGAFTQLVALILIIQFLVIIIWKLKKREKFVNSLELDFLILAGLFILLTVSTKINLLNFISWI